MKGRRDYFDVGSSINNILGVSGLSDTSVEEKYVIGTIVSHEDSRGELFKILPSIKMFTTDRNREAWGTLMHMQNIGMPIDEISFLRELRRLNSWQGNIAMYEQFIEKSVPIVAKEHAEYIYANYCVRKVKTNAKKIVDYENISVKDIKAFLTDQMQLIDDLGRLIPSKDADIGNTMKMAVDLIENPKSVIPFPIKKLNLASGGMTIGHTTTLGGRTGHGKTTTLANCVDGWLKEGYIVRWYSREQKAEEMLQSCIFLNAGVDRQRARKGTLTNEDKEKIRSATLRMREPYSRLTIKDDIDNMDDTIADIVAANPKPQIVVDDFVQLISTSENRSGKRFEIEHIFKKYHWLQKRYGFATLMASQLSRAVEQRQFDNEPRISDLAEASFIEQLSENVILLWWEYKFLLEASTLEENQIKFIFGKTRFGKTGFKVLDIDPLTGKLS